MFDQICLANEILALKRTDTTDLSPQFRGLALSLSLPSRFTPRLINWKAAFHPVPVDPFVHRIRSHLCSKTRNRYVKARRNMVMIIRQCFAGHESEARERYPNLWKISSLAHTCTLWPRDIVIPWKFSVIEYSWLQNNFYLFAVEQ